MDPTQTQPQQPTRLQALNTSVQETKMPDELRKKLILLLQQAESAERSGQFAPLEQAEKYIRLVLSIPWATSTTDNLDTTHAKQMFDKNHYGMDDIKERIIEYLSVLQLQVQNGALQDNTKTDEGIRAPILCFLGLVGTGKTTLAYSIADAMGRSFVRIPFGGMGSALDLRGQSRVHPDAEPGHVVKALARAKSNNPVILLDEIDRVSEAARADIMGVLVELLDPEQNHAFTDHYLDYPVNLRNVLFVATANNTKHIATAVLDRLEVLQMPSYSDSEKIVIGRDYIFPKTRKASGLSETQLVIDETIWPAIVRPLGYDAGIRTLERTINGVCRKAARQIVDKKTETVMVNAENVKEFLPQ